MKNKLNNVFYSKNCGDFTLIYSKGVYYLFFHNIPCGKVKDKANPQELYNNEFGEIFFISFDDYFYSKDKQNTLKFIFEEVTNTLTDFTSNKPIIMNIFTGLLSTLNFAFTDKDTNKKNHVSFKIMVEEEERQYGKPRDYRKDYIKFLWCNLLPLPFTFIFSWSVFLLTLKPTPDLPQFDKH